MFFNITVENELETRMIQACLAKLRHDGSNEEQADT